MSDRTDALAQLLFDKPSLDACSLQQVDYLAHQYPYFTTAQLLRLQKTEIGSTDYAVQFQRTALHFSNPMLLQFWLNPTAFDTEIPAAELFQNPITETEPAAKELVDVSRAPERKSLMATESISAKEAEPQPVEAALKPAVEPNLKTQDADGPAITFEPYHTVDYFASQGIKLSQQEAANDALGKQVKSFTEWLKTMKRIPEKTAAQPVDAAGERKVENLAAHSLEAPDVTTESMAEVWLKQGNAEKAAEVYRKLSLRNPSKSAYFAAKIESLKED